MHQSTSAMLERVMARDRAADGRFVTGVVTTGIYCLPSCPARKPKPENVRFFAGEAEALAAGLRPCHRCRPDDFYARRDPELELVRELDDRVRARIQDYRSTQSLARAAGFGVTKLGELLRRHFHTSPTGYLQQRRVEAVMPALLETRRRVLDIGIETGFESSSAFHDNFKRLTGMSPQQFRGLGRANEFAIYLPDDFRREDTLAYLARNPDSPDERRTRTSFVKALTICGKVARLEIDLVGSRARCRVAARGAIPPRGMAEAHAIALRLLGLGTDSAGFERRARRDGLVRRLVRDRRGMRIPLCADEYEALTWALVGQQITVAFAHTCRARLIELAGRRAGDGLVAHPSPQEVARLDHADLTSKQFSRRKAEYVIDTARAISRGELHLHRLRSRSAVQIERELSAVRGIGPWTVQYVLMRGVGLGDCVPLGDVALCAALEKFYELSERPDVERTRALMAPFTPHRSLASFHLWRSLRG